MGERYKMISKESKGILRGEYGALPGEVNEDVRRKAIGDDEVVTCRPADLIEPELAKYREETKGIAKCEEDVLSVAMFPQVAPKFLAYRDGPKEPKPETEAAKSEPKSDANAVRTLWVQDVSEGK